MKIGNIQLELISKARKYLRQNLDENINVHSSGICYLCSFALSPGYAKLKLWEKGFKNILNICKRKASTNSKTLSGNFLL